MAGRRGSGYVGLVSAPEGVPKNNNLKSKDLLIHGKLRLAEEIACPRGSTAVAFTDDLKLLAVGQENGAVELFESSESVQLLYDSELQQESEPCTDIKVRTSRRNNYHKSILVTYLSGFIKLWDTKIGKCIFTIKEKRQVYGVNYHPNTCKFLTFGDDFKLNLYDEERRVTERILACSEVVGSKNGHTASVCCGKFHPKNPFEVLSSGLDGTIQFWDLRMPYAVRNIQDVITFGEAVDISHDGKTIVAGMANARSGTVRMYDYDSGLQICEHSFLDTHIYCCRFIAPSYVGVGGFRNNVFFVGNVVTGEVFDSVKDLQSPVMSFAEKKCHSRDIPDIVVSSGERVLLLERRYPEEDDSLSENDK